MTSQKVNKESLDIVQEKISKLRQIIPECFSERVLNIEKLQRTIGNVITSDNEGYTLNWSGRNDTFKNIQSLTKSTLVPDKKESVNFDKTEHVFIEGENLEVLKLLQKSYFGKIKMIYIDPPYNTGSDFIYKDNFHDGINFYLEQTGQSKNGVRLTTNPETSGRFHSDWISFMYTRLYLAKNLLSDDGVIFVSIDDHEVQNLKFIMNEIFGEESFISQLVWKSRQNKDNRNITGVSIDHEYVLCYGKRIRGDERKKDSYLNPDNDPRGNWTNANMVGLLPEKQRPNCHYDLIDPKTKINYGKPTMGWRYDKNTMNKLIMEDKILWPDHHSKRPRRKKFLYEIKNEFTGFSSIIGNELYTKNGTAEIEEIFGSRVMEFPKPSKLIQDLIVQGSGKDDIILDSFAGSGTTAHAVLELNKKDNGNRKFIVVQIPEKNENAINNEYSTIADICKERIRRVIKKLDKEKNLGFKVFKLAKSNYKTWDDNNASNKKNLKNQIKLFEQPLIAKYKNIDVIYECIIKEGFNLNSNIEKINTKPNTVYKITDNNRSFYMCLDNVMYDTTIKLTNITKNDMFICIDASLNDSQKTNITRHCRLKTL